MRGESQGGPGPARRLLLSYRPHVARPFPLFPSSRPPSLHQKLQKMCGRYALGLDSDELESYLDAQLFNQRHASPDEEDNADQLADPQPEQQNPGGGSPREPVASGSGSSAGSDARASGADAKGKGKSSELGLHWDVSAKAAYRPRYNVSSLKFRVRGSVC